MGKIQSIRILKSELDSGYIPFNHVMIESDLTIEGKKTKGGIIYGHDEDTVFYSERENADTSWEADVAQVSGDVYKVPQRLYYNKEDTNSSMPWLCDMEVEIGDTVWFPPLESRNATAFECDGKYFKLIPYRDLIVAKRKSRPPHCGIPGDIEDWNPIEQIICLNGYTLLEPVYYVNKSPLSLSKQGECDKTRGIVRYLGFANREYIAPQYVDFQNLEVGDEVLLSPKTPLFLLERKSYLASFDNEKLYWCVQRRRIALVLSKGN